MTWSVGSELNTTNLNDYSCNTMTATMYSFTTAADATGLTSGELQIVFAASGISLIFSSGNSYYIINSATSAVQA